MTWVAVGTTVAGAVVSSAMAPDSTGGGAGATSDTKTPWAPAAPWLKNNIKTGQSLQSQYAATPFNNQQLSAYGAMGDQTAYMNKLIPSLMGQLGAQQSGFDRNNPSAKPQAFNFGGLMGSSAGGGQPAPSAPANGAQPGLLGMLGSSGGSGFTSAANPIPSAVAPTGDASFMQSDDRNSGGYGSFNYGDPLPEPGTQAYRDMSAYFNNGGADPMNHYGRKPQAAMPAPYFWGQGDMGGPGGSSSSSSSSSSSNGSDGGTSSATSA